MTTNDETHPLDRPVPNFIARVEKDRTTPKLTRFEAFHEAVLQQLETHGPNACWEWMEALESRRHHDPRFPGRAEQTHDFRQQLSTLLNILHSEQLKGLRVADADAPPARKSSSPRGTPWNPSKEVQAKRDAVRARLAEIGTRDAKPREVMAARARRVAEERHRDFMKQALRPASVKREVRTIQSPMPLQQRMQQGFDQLLEDAIQEVRAA